MAEYGGALSDRIGGRPLLVIGLAMQAIGLGWLAAVTTPTVAYTTLVPAFVVAGIGMSLFFAPVAAALALMLPRLRRATADTVAAEQARELEMVH